MKFAAVVAGVSGNAYAIRANGARVALQPGAQLAVSDTVQTDSGSALTIVFHDNTEIRLGAGTRVAIKGFAFDPAGNSEPSLMLHMATGVVRSISGKVVEQNPEGFQLSSPLGVVGIRGTTTIHEIRETYEIHSVVELSQGHQVVVTTHDGRSAIITDSLKQVRIDTDRTGPLAPEDFSKEDLDEYVRELASLDMLRDSVSELYLITGVEGLGSLGTDFYYWRMGFLGAFEHRGSGFEKGPSESPGSSGVLSRDGLRLLGSMNDDVLIGSNGNDYIHGFKGNDYINAGLGADTVFGGYGSRDIIVKPGLMSVGNYLHGDDDILPSGAEGDDDVVRVMATAGDGPGDMTGGFIYGDARLIDGGEGGADSVIVDGNMSGGAIYGDAHVVAFGDLGNDLIAVRGVMSGGAVYGDAEKFVAECRGGDDEIFVGAMTGGAIYGDAHAFSWDVGGEDTINIGAVNGGALYGDAFSLSNATAGDDEITVNVMNGGVIYGDGHTLANSIAGDDEIYIGLFNGGTIYGDGASMDANMAKGADVIHIGAVGGGAVKTIYGGCGDDVFIFDADVRQREAVVRICDFEADDELDVGAFGQSAVSQLVDGGDLYVTCAANGNELTIILENVAYELQLLFG